MKERERKERGKIRGASCVFIKAKVESGEALIFFFFDILINFSILY